MLFNSVHFLLFFPIVALAYYLLPFKARWVWLLVASYYFYMSWNPTYALLIAFSTVTTWLCGILVGKSASHKRLWVALSLIINLSILFFFKYFEFALGNLNAVLGLLHVQAVQPGINILLPVGISFYTFQALGYTIDVYRGDVAVEKNLGKYALFVSFFPQLVAGPIERSANLIRQIHEDHPFKYNNITAGLPIMLWGFFEKLVVADRAAILVDKVFGNYTEYAGMELLAASLLFAFQIYGDFSGYSHIAIGAAKVMGFDLMTNFRQPYFSKSIREFWQRWHISLSTWFRDYLYIPLGGNRKGRFRKYFNTMVTFLVSGLWHGASWNYVVWGGLHGLYQVTGDVVNPLRKKLTPPFRRGPGKILYGIFRTIFVFILVDFAWIFFRAPGMNAAFSILRSLFTFQPIGSGFLESVGFSGREIVILVLAILFLLAADFYMLHRKALGSLKKQKNVLRWAVYYILLYIVVRYGAFGSGYQPSAFIYFQF